MLVYLTTTILILNVVTSIFVTKKLYEGRALSKYKPRYDLLFCLVWSYVPLSFMSALTDILGWDKLNNYKYCSLFLIAKDMAFQSFIAAPALSIFLFLLLFTNFKIKNVNNIGNAMSLFLLVLFPLKIYFALEFVGVGRSKFFEFGIPTECVYHSQRFISFNNYFKYFVQFLVVIFVSFVFVYEKYENYSSSKEKKENNKDSLNLKNSNGRKNLMKSFILIVFFTLVLDGLEKIMKLVDGNASFFYAFLNDIRRMKPFIYSLIIILCEKPASVEIKDYPVRRILEIPELRKIFEKFLKEKGKKKTKELVEKIRSEALKLEIPKKHTLIGNNEKEVIEKTKNLLDKLEKEVLFEGLSDFYLSDEFIWFLFRFQKLGVIELELDNERK